MTLLFIACSRSAEIADESGVGFQGPSLPRDETELVPVDAGFDGEIFTRCADRPVGSECSGANDFPCNFQAWVEEVSSSCQVTSGCTSNGRVVVQMGDEGCVAELQMSEPHEEFVRCVAERFGALRCPCRAQSVEVSLGYGSVGCGTDTPVPCGTGEFRCPVGQGCVEGYCRASSGEDS